MCKLFNMVQPDVAVFGQEDFQQCAVVRRMTADLNFPIEIIIVPTVREADGPALSSRNRYLSPQGRRRALAISRGLFAAGEQFQAGERGVSRLLGIVRQHLVGVDKLEYVDLVDCADLKPAESPLRSTAALCLAAYVGSTRLIDNIILPLPT